MELDAEAQVVKPTWSCKKQLNASLSKMSTQISSEAYTLSEARTFCF